MSNNHLEKALESLLKTVDNLLTANDDLHAVERKYLAENGALPNVLIFGISPKDSLYEKIVQADIVRRKAKRDLERAALLYARLSHVNDDSTHGPIFNTEDLTITGCICGMRFFGEDPEFECLTHMTLFQ